MPPRRTPSGAWAPLLIIIVVLLLAAPTSGEEATQGSGSGHWGPEGEQGPANASWILMEDQVVAFHVEADNGTRASCTEGNGTIATNGGAGAAGTCGGTLSDGRVTLFLRIPGAGDGAPETRFNGTFENDGAGGTADPAGLTPLELTLGVVAAAAVAGTTVLAVLFVRERRLTGHLARRLYERSRGKRAHKHPDHSAEERVRRILVRSKN